LVRASRRDAAGVAIDDEAGNLDGTGLAQTFDRFDARLSAGQILLALCSAWYQLLTTGRLQDVSWTGAREYTTNRNQPDSEDRGPSQCCIFRKLVHDNAIWAGWIIYRGLISVAARLHEFGENELDAIGSGMRKPRRDEATLGMRRRSYELITQTSHKRPTERPRAAVRAWTLAATLGGLL
jgi:hypothetical protein